jgi:hypothetical protein
MSEPLVGTESAATSIARVNYSHDAMIDLLIANPSITQNALAKHFGYSVAWVSRIRNSDAFLARLAERKEDLVDPTILLTIDERFKAMASASMEIVQRKLEETPNFDQAIVALELSSKALGYGARQANVNVQQNFVVAMPSKAPTTQAWVEKYSGSALEAPVAKQSPDLAQLVERAA